MSAITESQVLEALRTVKPPELRDNIVNLRMIQDVAVTGSDVSFGLVLSPPAERVKDAIIGQCRAAVGKIPGVGGIQIRTTSTGAVAPPQKSLPGIANVIGVASGKGGVGKSTVAVNLACALQQTGARVGLLDADIYGPSIPMMMNAYGELEADPETKKLIPFERHGIRLMSVGFINTGGDPIIWRGPIVSRMIQQFITDVDWGELDYLLVDLPPGTGDAPLTLAQAVPLNGVVIVLTPQDVALDIASKSLAMFQRPPFHVPILGIVENMSTFVCPNCNVETPIFGREGGSRTATDFGVPFLGSIPLNRAICDAGDAGTPIIVSAPDSPQGEAFRKVADEVLNRLGMIAAASREKKGGVFVGLERLLGGTKRK